MTNDPTHETVSELITSLIVASRATDAATLGELVRALEAWIGWCTAHELPAEVFEHLMAKVWPAYAVACEETLTLAYLA
jgi:hypothetical protein